MILVTGANGTTGRFLIKKLSSLGLPTRALVRNLEKSQGLDLPNVELFEGDLTQADLSPIFDGIDKVYLVTSGAKDSVDLQIRAIDAAKHAQVSLLVKHSGLGASAESSLHLSRWHAQIELHLRNSGLKYTILQPHFYMQNLLWDAPSIVGQQKLVSAMGDASFSLVDARDIAAVAAVVLSSEGHEGKVYPITGGQAVSYQEIAAEISHQTGHVITHHGISPEQYRLNALASGTEDWFASDMAGLFDFFSTGKAAFISPSVQTLTGKAPISIKQFVTDYRSAFLLKL